MLGARQVGETTLAKQLVKSPRYYIRDSGIQHRLLGIGTQEALRSNPLLRKSWEGFAVENIHSILPRRAETYFYRTSAGTEIDLVFEISGSGSLKALFIAFPQSPERLPASASALSYGGI